jgi:hypothetical protein
MYKMVEGLGVGAPSALVNAGIILAKLPPFVKY